MPGLYQKKFTDKRKLNTMLELRKQGWSLVSLGIIFGVDFSSIYHLCKKYHIEKGDEELVFNLKHIIALTNVSVRLPKSYADYLEEDRNRRKACPN